MNNSISEYKIKLFFFVNHTNKHNNNKNRSSEWAFDKFHSCMYVYIHENQPKTSPNAICVVHSFFPAWKKKKNGISDRILYFFYVHRTQRKRKATRIASLKHRSRVGLKFMTRTRGSISCALQRGRMEGIGFLKTVYIHPRELSWR